jgi:hypothetical protein
MVRGIWVEDGVLGCVPFGEVEGVEGGGSDELELSRLGESGSVWGSEGSVSATLQM